MKRKAFWFLCVLLLSSFSLAQLPRSSPQAANPWVLPPDISVSVTQRLRPSTSASGSISTCNNNGICEPNLGESCTTCADCVGTSYCSDLAQICNRYNFVGGDPKTNPACATTPSLCPVYNECLNDTDSNLKAFLDFLSKKYVAPGSNVISVAVPQNAACAAIDYWKPYLCPDGTCQAGPDCGIPDGKCNQSVFRGDCQTVPTEACWNDPADCGPCPTIANISDANIAFGSCDPTQCAKGVCAVGQCSTATTCQFNCDSAHYGGSYAGNPTYQSDAVDFAVDNASCSPLAALSDQVCLSGAHYISYAQDIPGTLHVSINTRNGSFLAYPDSPQVNSSWVPGKTCPSPTGGISVSPTQITFLATIVNTTSQPVQVTVSNNGTANLVVSDIATQDPFAITNFSSNITTGITPNTQGTFDALFRPTTAGQFSGSITITSNAPTSPTAVSLQGTGTLPMLAVKPSSLSFAYQKGTIGQIAPQQTTVASNGPALAFTATVSSIKNWLSITPTTGTTPASISVSVASNLPPGTYTGQIIVASSTAANTPQTVGVTLTVATPEMPIVSGFLTFPLKSYTPSQSVSLDLTSETAFVNSVFDHSMSDAMHYGIYGCDQTVTAFSGQSGIDIDPQLVFLCNAAYAQNQNKTPFTIQGMNYSGPRDATYPNGDNQHLYYDGHAGIDYRSELKNFVYAAADGVISYPPQMVGISNMARAGNLVGAAAYHVLELNPASHPDYRIYYLHLYTYYDATQEPVAVTDPFPSPGCPAVVALPIPPNTSVKAGCLIALSGNQAPGGVTPHLHFEVQRVIPKARVSNAYHAQTNAACKDKGGFVCLPVDPYGWTGQGTDPYETLTGVSNKQVLWQH